MRTYAIAVILAILLLIGVSHVNAMEWRTAEVMEDALKDTLKVGYHGVWSVDLSPIGTSNYSEVLLTINSTNFQSGVLEQLIQTSANEFAFVYHAKPEEYSEIKTMVIQIYDEGQDRRVALAWVESSWISDLDFDEGRFTATKESLADFDRKVLITSDIREISS